MTDLSNNPRPIDLAIERVEELVAAADEWMAKVPQITSAELAGRAVDFDEQLLATHQKLDGERAAERKPHADAAAAVQAAWKPLLDRLLLCRKMIGDKLRPWQAAEQLQLDAKRDWLTLMARAADDRARKAGTEEPNIIAAIAKAQEASREAADAWIAANRLPDRAQVRGALSGRARSLRREWRATVTEPLSFIIWLTRNREIELNDFLADYAQLLARTGERDIPGVKIEQVEV
jgi:hypothetical protein